MPDRANADARSRSPLMETADPMFDPSSVGVTAVIAHYGAVGMTAALVDQLRAQRTDRTIQIVVSDDASPEPFPTADGYEVVRAEANGGFGAAVNRGAGLAKHPLLLILNSDLSVNATFVDDLLAAAAPWLPDHLCGPRIYEPKGRESEPRRYPRQRFYFVEWLGFLARWRDSPQWAHLTGSFPLRSRDVAASVDWVVGAAMLVATDHFRSIGGMDEQFHMYMEEVDLQRRLRAVGVPSAYLGSVTVEHHKAGSTPGIDRRLAAVLNARLLYELKWSGWAAVRRLQLLLSVATVLDLASDTLRRARGVGVAPLVEARRRFRFILTRPTPFRRHLD